jgi:hypothetical protein
VDAVTRAERAALAGGAKSDRPRKPPPQHAALDLQRAAGNRAVSGLLTGATAAPIGIVLRQPVQAPPTPAPTPTRSPTPQEQAAHDTMVAEHTRQQARINALVNSGRATVPGSPTEFDRDALFRNSCEWIAAGRATMRVLSRTHDSTTRRPGSVAFFDPQVHYPNVGGTYAVLPDASDADHVYFAAPGFQGGMTHSTHMLEVLEPAGKSDEELTSILIHEVQHDADLTGSGEPGASPGAPGLTGSAQLQSAGLFNDYQTEFRAHWLETSEGSPGDQYGSSRAPASNAQPVAGPSTTPGGPPVSVPTAFLNQRQERIFWWLVRNRYGYDVPYRTDPAFKQMVDSFDRPMGVNVINSLRVRAVLDALGACTPSQSATDTTVRAVITAFDALDSNDLVFLGSPDAQPFWDDASTHLPGTVLRRLRFRASLPVEDYGPRPTGDLVA